MSMWCLMAAPLIFSGDMTKLDEFTLNVLCNAEMIAVDQDPLGRQAKIIAPIATQQPLVGPSTANTLILGKPMEDGSQVVGLFNLSAVSQTITVEWKDLGIAGQQNVSRPVAAERHRDGRWPICDAGRTAWRAGDPLMAETKVGRVLVRYGR